MSWTAPRTWIALETVTASLMNTHVRDNLTELRAGNLASGLQFPAVQVPSADVNFLDDYEEGTWTPVLGGSGGTSGQAYGVQKGVYVKIGKNIFFWGYVALTTKGTITTNLELQGLPFASENVANQYGSFNISYWENMVSSMVSMSGFVNANASSAPIKGMTVGGTTIAQLATADIGNTTGIMFNGMYRAAN